jgi:hypothetical protein
MIQTFCRTDAPFSRSSSEPQRIVLLLYGDDADG